ncbi:hypothetical protein HFP51_08855 [Parasphingopyxis sp. CP4]|uniref:rhamnan synthesis F family protein n=1 Tax=Parasphingopyxis sp. CP4 TaxID=2724527 RepID=UPI0015A17B66|nr:rhamnan synthesis F family protein [Parasphingopyxis sp. CP4]QLC22274.1 hypothetical protein HFP51_08855 [Parasphingopyxis sp. CP4]
MQSSNPDPSAPQRFRITGFKADQEDMLISKLRESGMVMESPLRQHPSLAGNVRPNSKILVHFHIYYEDLVDELIECLCSIPMQFDLVVTIVDDRLNETVKSALAKRSTQVDSVTVLRVPNQGRDILPFITVLRRAGPDYDIVCHAHSKKSIHAARLKGWRSDLLGKLFATPDAVAGILHMLNSDGDIGLVFPEYFPPIVRHIHWGQNGEMAAAAARRMGFEVCEESLIPFPAGSMFWARRDALLPLINSDIGPGDFPEEQGQQDRTLAHALERLVGEIASHAGYAAQLIGFAGADGANAREI